MLSALGDEAAALDALEAESLRQQQQHHQALKYGQYLSMLSVNVAAASGGTISMLRLPPESDEIRHTLAEMGVPTGSLRVLHAYRLRNTRLHEAFNLLANSQSDSLPATSPASRPLSHRLLAMRLSPASVEHLVVHGLHPKEMVGTPEEWQVDPRSVPEAGCVDLASLANLIRGSTPPPQPFALFTGRAAWEVRIGRRSPQGFTSGACLTLPALC